MSDTVVPLSDTVVSIPWNLSVCGSGVVGGPIAVGLLPVLGNVFSSRSLLCCPPRSFSMWIGFHPLKLVLRGYCLWNWSRGFWVPDSRVLNDSKLISSLIWPALGASPLSSIRRLLLICVGCNHWSGLHHVLKDSLLLQLGCEIS